MAVCRVVYKPDGKLSIIHYDPKSKYSREQAFNIAMEKQQMVGYEYEDIDDSELPSREFRDAWEKEKGKPFKINDTKKDEIIKERSKKTLEERIKILEDKVL